LYYCLIGRIIRVDTRKAYENYLIDEFSNIPHHDVSDMKEIPKMDRPDMAAIQDYYEIIDPKEQRVPVERLKEARKVSEQRQAMKASFSSGIEWDCLESDMGGRTRSLMWDPNNESKLWAGSVTGGLWYNNDVADAESSWHPVSDMWENLSISSITYDPNNPNIFYVGTGEIETSIVTYRESSGKGVGIWKSTDAGASWELLPSTSEFEYITGIVVRNEGFQHSVIYAGVGSGTYKGVNHLSQPSDGLFRSEDDGATWTQVLPNITDEDVPYTPSDVKLAADGTIFVGTGRNIEEKGAATILVSSDGTAGSWSVFEDYRILIENDSYYNLPGRVKILPAPSDENIVYAIIAGGYTNGFGYYYGRYILKSEDKGVTWNTINKPDSDGSWANLAWHAMVGAVDPNNPDHLFVGGLDEYNTLNSGASWTHVSDWAMMYYGGGDDYVHADQHAIAFKPGSSDVAVFGTDGGVFYTNSASQNYPVFQQRSKNYSSLQFYSADVCPTEDVDEYLGGLQDNGSLYYQGQNFDIDDMISGGDGAYVFFDEDQTERFITSVYYNRYYIFNNGSQTGQVGIESGTFICPADYDSKENTIYANGCDFFGEGADEILRISNITSYSSDEDFLDMNTGTEVPFTAVTASKLDNGTVYFGSQSGKLFMATGMNLANQIVTEIGSDDFPVGAISCIALSADEQSILVTFSNYGVTSVWLSVDGGDSWLNKEGELPDMPVRWAIFHPENDNQVLLATELGIWETNTLKNDITYWVPAIDGMSSVRVDMLKIRANDNTVVAATHGRGLYHGVYPLDYCVTDVATADNETGISIYPNPAQSVVTVDYKNLQKGNYSLNVFDINSRCVLKKNISVNENGKYILDINTLTKGEYIVQMGIADKKFTQKLIVM